MHSPDGDGEVSGIAALRETLSRDDVPVGGQGYVSVDRDAREVEGIIAKLEEER